MWRRRQTVGQGVPGPHAVQAAGGRVSPDGERPHLRQKKLPGKSLMQEGL